MPRRRTAAFFRWIRERRPLVTLKAAATLDGFIAPAGRAPPTAVHWITGEPARAGGARAARRARRHPGGRRHRAGRRPAADRAACPGARRAAARCGWCSTAGCARPPPRACSRERGGRAARWSSAPAAGARQPAPLERRRRALGRAGAEVLLLPAAATASCRSRAVLRHLAERERAVAAGRGGQPGARRLHRRRPGRRGGALLRAPAAGRRACPSRRRRAACPGATPLRLGPARGAALSAVIYSSPPTCSPTRGDGARTSGEVTACSPASSKHRHGRGAAAGAAGSRRLADLDRARRSARAAASAASIAVDGVCLTVVARRGPAASRPTSAPRRWRCTTLGDAARRRPRPPRAPAAHGRPAGRPPGRRPRRRRGHGAHAPRRAGTRSSWRSPPRPRWRPSWPPRARSPSTASA